MSDPKRPDQQHDTDDKVDGADTNLPDVEDAELVETPDTPPAKTDPLVIPDDDNSDDEVQDDETQDNIIAAGADTVPGDTVPGDGNADDVSPDVDTGETPQDDADSAIPGATAAAATTPWGGAPADVNARSTSDPASPSYVAPDASSSDGISSDDEYHEDTGSVAGRVLFWLFLLVAGAVLILWAGPKVAPNLPSGLAPVAEWLTPGQRAAQMQVEEMEARLNARIDTLDTGLTPEGVEERIDAAMVESEQRSAESITALSAQVNDLSDQVAAADSAAIEERLAQVETRLEGITAEMSSLRSDLTGLAAGEGGITGQNAAQIDAFTAALEGLQAELDSISARNGALDQRIDEVAATAERQLATAREEVAAAQAEAEAQVAVASEQAAMTELANALDTGEPFEEPLADLAEQVEIPAPLPELAPTGVPTQVALETSFPEVARQAIRAEIAPGEDDNILSSASAFLRSRVAGRSLVEREGDDADAILSRVEARLRRGNLEAALTEAEQLSGAPAETLSSWTADLRARHDALSAYRTLAERLDADN